MRVIFSFCLFYLVSARVAKAAEVLRPRGVPLFKSSLYDPTREFHCLDGSGTISFTYVNDDYCDCQDGSDEPGTSACPNGSFNCPNAGHEPLNVPSSRVNDGVCDCCDASDEYASNANCVDTCRELGRAAREEAAKQRQERMKGFELRKAMIEDGRKLKKEAEVKIEELKKEKEEAEKVKAEKEEAKQIAEEPEKVALEQYTEIETERKEKEEADQKAKDDIEAREAFAHLDNDGDGILTMIELQSRQTFDTNRDGEVSEDEAKFYLRQEESMSLETFLTSGWQMIRPTYKHDRRMFIPPTPAPSEESLESPPVEFNDEDENEDEEDDGLDDDLEDDYDMGEDAEDAQEDTQNEEEDPKYDEETQKLVDAANAARGEYDEADRQVRDLARELRSLEETQEKDYGPDEVFRVLEGNCYEYSDREYIYRLCAFDKAVQKPKSGHGETRIGQWGEWSGPEHDKYSRMLYPNGQACWNGPTRSADVRLYCGTETKLTSVTEPNRCEYLFMLGTPAVCFIPDDISGDEGTEHGHTEL